MTQREITAGIEALLNSELSDKVPADDVISEFEAETIVRNVLAAAEQARMDELTAAMG